SVLSRSLLFWRSFTHLIGGMGVLVFALAIMDNAKNSHLEVMKAEVPGPVFGKVVSKLKNTAQILYLLYLALFSLFVIIYYFGVNFNLYYYLMLRRIKAFFGDEELRAYLVIVLVSTGLISLNTLYLYPGFSKSFEMTFFQVSNIITTTGFGY
ncbi:potassium transporter TrkG, partial [Streptococcus pneumoniae]|uniref:potassium transporter TrkG n=1 Tax=Streptococcus pneumoniae TaxID=1313 RepID=UPI000A8FB244